MLTPSHLFAAIASGGANYVAQFSDLCLNIKKNNKIAPGMELWMPTQLETTFTSKLESSEDHLLEPECWQDLASNGLFRAANTCSRFIFNC